MLEQDDTETNLYDAGLVMQGAFFDKRTANDEDEMMLAQLEETQPQIMQLVKRILTKQPLKGIHDTKFVLFGQIWSVWDWTVFVIILFVILVSFGLTILLCICCGPTQQEDEEELEEELKLERQKHELLTLREMNKQHNVHGRMNQALEGTEKNQRKPVTREIAKAEEKLGNEVLTGKKPVQPDQQPVGDPEYEAIKQQYSKGAEGGTGKPDKA